MNDLDVMVKRLVKLLIRIQVSIHWFCWSETEEFLGNLVHDYDDDDDDDDTSASEEVSNWVSELVN